MQSITISRLSCWRLMWFVCCFCCGQEVVARSLLQEAAGLSYDEILQTMCSVESSEEKPKPPQNISQTVQQRFPFSLIGSLRVYDFSTGRTRICSALVLTTRAVLSSGNCFYTRSTTDNRGQLRIGTPNQIAQKPMTFELYINETIQSYPLQSFTIPKEFQGAEVSDSSADTYNYGVGFLTEELDASLVQRKFRFPASGGECKAGEVSDIVGFDHNKVLQWVHGCQYDKDGCDTSCKVDFNVSQTGDYNGAPIVDCYGSEECKNAEKFTIRGVYDQASVVPLDGENVAGIIYMLQLPQDSSEVISVSEDTLTPYEFTPETAAFSFQGLTEPPSCESEEPPRICEPCRECSGTLEVWHLVLAVILTVLVIGVVECGVWWCCFGGLKRQKSSQDVMAIEEELEDDVDLQININRDIQHIKRLGQGGFGEVYKGVWRPKARLVAFKTIRQHNVILQDTGVNERQIEEMKQELLFLCKMRHPNILHCYGGSLYPDTAMVMEYCKGGDLYDYIYSTREGALSLEECYSVGYDVASGLAFLHSNNLIHRDIKTKNILRTKSSIEKVGLVKIADFGLARQIPDEQSQWDTGKNMGTIVYMAPELHLGADNKVKIGRKVDIYSLGMVLYECATGTKPWDGINQNIVSTKACNGDRPQIPENVDPVLAEIIGMCWAQQPKNRPDSESLVSKFRMLLVNIGSSRGKQLVDLRGRVMRYGSGISSNPSGSERALPPIEEQAASQHSTKSTNSSVPRSPFSMLTTNADENTLADNTALFR